MQLFKTVPTPQDLEKNIFLLIEKKEKQKSTLLLIFTSVLATCSCIGIIPSVIYLVKGFEKSGFYQYLSLIFSDGSLLLTYWKEFSLSLVESMPYWGLLIFLTLLGIFIWSLGKTAREAKIVLHRNALA